MRAVVGLDRPTAGEVLVAGRLVAAALLLRRRDA